MKLEAFGSALSAIPEVAAILSVEYSTLRRFRQQQWIMVLNDVKTCLSDELRMSIRIEIDAD